MEGLRAKDEDDEMDVGEEAKPQRSSGKELVPFDGLGFPFTCLTRQSHSS